MSELSGVLYKLSEPQVCWNNGFNRMLIMLLFLPLWKLLELINNKSGIMCSLEYFIHALTRPPTWTKTFMIFCKTLKVRYLLVSIRYTQSLLNNIYSQFDRFQPNMLYAISLYDTQRKQFLLFWNRNSSWCRALMKTSTHISTLYIVSKIGLRTIK